MCRVLHYAYSEKGIAGHDVALLIGMKADSRTLLEFLTKVSLLATFVACKQLTYLSMKLPTLATPRAPLLYYS